MPSRRAFLLITLPAAAQIMPQKEEPLPTFKGAFQSAADSKLYLNADDENQIEFWITRKTVILDGTKKIKVSDLKQGTRLTVEAKRVVGSRMDAVIVRVDAVKQN